VAPSSSPQSATKYAFQQISLSFGGLTLV
jgi:hypothetical protein